MLPPDIGSSDSTITSTLNGAAGGGVGTGGAGGQVIGTLANIADGSTLSINVGEAPNGTTGGYPDGGNGAGGHDNGGGGGGGTILLDGSTKVAEAGGGGGYGGYGGGTNPSNGGAGGSTGGGAGGGNDSCSGGGGGGGGAGASGGGGGGAGDCFVGSNGDGGGGHSGSTGGNGGSGHGTSTSGGGGGGGGGGWVGGGGGGGGGTDGSGGGGGGGSDNWDSTFFSGSSNPGSGAATDDDGTASVSWTLLPATVTVPSITANLGDPSTTLSATVSDSVGYAPTGTVSFFSNAEPACTGTVANGVASCTFNDTTPGEVDYGGLYSGDDTLKSTEGIGLLTGVVDPTSTGDVQVTVNSGATPTLGLQATVTPQSYSPGWATDNQSTNNQVNFFATSPQSSTPVQVCTTTVPTSSVAASSATVGCTFGTTAPFPSPGVTYSITATFEGDGDNGGSSSPSAGSGTVGAYSTTTSLVANGSPSALDLIYGTTASLQATVHNLPSSDNAGGGTATGTVTYEYAVSGDPVACVGQTQPMAVTLGSGTGPVTGTAPPCVFVPGVDSDQSTVVAAYSGDTQSSSSTSGSPTISVTQATTTVPSLTAAGLNGNSDIGVPVTITATVASNAGVAPDGAVSFSAGSGSSATPITGCTAVTGVAGGVPGAERTTYTCTLGAAPTALGTESFSAAYCPSGTTDTACDNWGSSGATTNYTPNPDPTTVSLDPAGSELHPVNAVGGQAVTVTATVALSAGDVAPDTSGTVSFVENGNPVTPASGPSCTNEPLVAGPGSGSAATATAACSFVPDPGGEDQVVVLYNVASGSLTASSGSPVSYYSVSGAPTVASLDVVTPTATVPSGGDLPFGEPLTLAATVTSGGVPVAQGTVAFTVNGSPASAGGSVICQQVAVSNGVATCLIPDPGAGGVSFGASYAYAGGSFADSVAPAATYTVSAAATSTTLAVGPDPDQAGALDLTATVNTAAGSTASPTGTVSFSGAASCASVALVAASTGSATATCAGITAPTTPTPYGATYTPDSADFVGSTATGVTFTPGAACSSTFGALWTAAGLSGSTLNFAVGGSVGTVSVQVGGVTGACTSSSALPFSGGSLSFLGGSLSAASGLSGYLVDGSGGGAPSLCLTGGSLSLPGHWNLGSLPLSASADLCFSLTGTSSLGAITTGNLIIPNITLPFGAPDGSVPYNLELSFTAGSPTQMVVSLAPASTPGSTPYVNATITVALSGSTPAATGQATIENLPFGGPVTASFSVGAGTAGTLAPTISFSFAPSSAPYAPLPGLELENIDATLSSTGLSFSASAVLGNTAEPLTLAITGSYASGTFTLGVTAADPGTWSPFSTLSISLASLTGTVTISTGGDVTYDFEAGTPPVAGTTAVPLVAWNPVTGVVVDIDCIALAFGRTPACASGSVQSPTDPSLSLEGSVALGGTSGGLTVGVQGAIDLRTGGVNFTLDANAVAPTVTIVSGLTVTLDSLSVTGGVGSGIDVVGLASASIPSLGSSPITVTVSEQNDALIVAVAGIDLSKLGIPLTDGFFAYSSAPVAAYPTGDSTFGTVSLVAGFNGDAVYTPSSGVVAALEAAGFTLPPGGTISFSGSWNPGSSPTFTAALTAPVGFPFLALPDGGAITGATVSFGGGLLSLEVNGLIPVPGQGVATVVVDVDVGTSDGSFTGTATVSGLTVFGVNIGLVGTISRSAAGVITANIASCQPNSTTCTVGPIAGPITPFPGVPVQLSNVDFSLGTSGLMVSATLSVAGLTTLDVSGTLVGLKQWTLTVSAAQAQAWQPAPSVTIDAMLSGTITDNNGPVSFTLAATGVGANPLFVLNVGGVALTVNSVQLGNATPPSGCTVGTAGDLWLYLDGSIGISLAGFSGSASAQGCFDLTAKTLDLSATLTGLSASFAGGTVLIGAPTFTLSESGGTYQLAATLLLTVEMPGGGSLSVNATLDFLSGGAFVVGAEANLSQWLGGSGDTAYLYYASQAVSGFQTGDPTIGAIDLGQGLTFALTITLPQSVISDLGDVGINLPSGTGLVALGTADFATDTYSLRISVSFGSGITLFSDGGATMVLNSGFLQVGLSPAGPSFSVGLAATLDLPSPGSVGAPSSVALTGELTVTDLGINVSLSLGNCAGSAPGWVGAFGVSGLTVKCADIQGGISFGDGIPLPNIGFDGTITSLPSNVANAIGYMNDAPITFAFNFDPFLLSLSIGTENSGTPALEPLAAFGQGSLIQVDYASLYISPEGATIGQNVYPPGLGLGFQATIDGVAISVLANVGFSPPSINFTGTLSQIVLSGLTIGPVSITLAASPTNFEFQFDGSLALGPGTVKIGPALEVGGSLSASVEVDISTSGLAFYISGSVGVDVSVYVPTAACYYGGVIPYPCDYEWQGTSGSFTLGRTGFAVNSGGVTLEADGYSLTFDWSGSVSISEDNFSSGAAPGQVFTVAQRGTTVTHAGRHGPSTSKGRARALPIALASDDTPVASAGPMAVPHLPAPSGTAVLVDENSSGTPQHPVKVETVVPQNKSATVVPTTPVAPQGNWTPTAALQNGRAYAVVATLPGGDVLEAGGFGSGNQVMASAEVYDPATGRWTTTGSMTDARVGASSVVLADGDVLVAGGIGQGRTPLASAELYDPSSGTWSATGSMPVGRAFADAGLIGNSGVLVAGGTGAGHAPLASAVRYDPSSRTWSVTGSMSTPRAFATGTSLPGGDFLMAGGLHSGGVLASAERYSPSSGTWTSAGSMSEPRMMATSTVLHGGDVLVVGDGANADRYHPSTNTWSATEGMEQARTLLTVTTLANGEVLAAGGESAGTATATAEVYHPSDGAWTSAGSMFAPRAAASAVALSNGNVLETGGADETTTAGGLQVTTTADAEVYALSSDEHHALAAGTLPVVPSGIDAGVVGVVVGGGLGLVLLAMVGYNALRWRRRRTGSGGAARPS